MARTKRQVLNEILLQCEKDEDSAGTELFGVMLEEVSENGTQDSPSIIEVTSNGDIFMIDRLLALHRPFIGEA